MKDLISEVFGISRWYCHLNIADTVSDQTLPSVELPRANILNTEGEHNIGIFIAEGALVFIQPFLKAMCDQHRWIVYEIKQDNDVGVQTITKLLTLQPLDYVILDTKISLNAVFKQCNVDYLAIDCERMNQAKYKKQVLHNAYSVPNFIA